MLREITRPKTNELFIKLPDSYVGQELEVLVLPSFEITTPQAKEKKLTTDNIRELFASARKYKVHDSIDLNALANEVNG